MIWWIDDFFFDLCYIANNDLDRVLQKQLALLTQNINGRGYVESSFDAPQTTCQCSESTWAQNSSKEDHNGTEKWEHFVSHWQIYDFVLEQNIATCV